MDATGTDVVSTLPPATESGTTSNNDGGCEIVKDGAGDGGLEESNDDEPGYVALQQAQADLVLVEG